MSKLLLGILLFLATACVPFTTAAPLPTRQAVKVSLPPSLRSWSSRLQACAARDPGMDLFIEEEAPEGLAEQDADLALFLGVPAGAASAYLVQVGGEDIVLLVNTSNPINQLSQAQISDLYSGKTARWEALAASPGGLAGEVQLWTYPVSDVLRQGFDSALLQGVKSQAQAMLAPDPQAMLEAVAADKNAIGYVPLSWMGTAAPELTNSLKQLKIDATLAQALRQPVLAAAAVEPQGAARALLVCLEQK